MSTRWLEPSPLDSCHRAVESSRAGRHALIERARTRLHALLAPEPAAWCAIETLVEVDRAYKAILRQARDGAADLIVMGAQGGGRLETMFYGSNTQHVLRAASRPVLTVKA